MPSPTFDTLAADVVALHDRLLAQPGWPALQPPRHAEQGDALTDWIEANHRNNSLLWAEEDLARRTRVADSDIAANKRAIDRYNQARNDATERVDEALLVALGLVDATSARTDTPVAHAPPGARLSSETAGSMIDRLSILALKMRAMREQTERTDVDAEHVATSRRKLARLLEQRTDLAGCLHALLAETRAGTAWFKVYRQFKMYNDARYNPQLVNENASHAARHPAARTGPE